MGAGSAMVSMTLWYNVVRSLCMDWTIKFFFRNAHLGRRYISQFGRVQLLAVSVCPGGELGGSLCTHCPCLLWELCHPLLESQCGMHGRLHTTLQLEIQDMGRVRTINGSNVVYTKLSQFYSVNIMLSSGLYCTLYCSSIYNSMKHYCIRYVEIHIQTISSQ